MDGVEMEGEWKRLGVDTGWKERREREREEV